MEPIAKRPVGRPRKHPLPVAKPKGDGLRRAAYKARLLAQDATPYAYPIRPPSIAPGVVPKGLSAPVLAMDTLTYTHSPDMLSGGGFPGFQYLAQLATRSEFRAMASCLST